MSGLLRAVLVAALFWATGCAGVLLRCGSVDLEVASPAADPSSAVTALALVFDEAIVSDTHPAPVRTEEGHAVYSFTTATQSNSTHRMLLVTLASGVTAAFVLPPGEPLSAPFTHWFVPDFVTDDQYPAMKLVRTGTVNRIQPEEPVHARYRFAAWTGCPP